VAQDSSNKSEKPTARHLRKAREEGQVARSMELPAAVMTLGGLLILIFLGQAWVQRISQLFAQGFTFDRKTLDQPQLMGVTFMHFMSEGLLLVLPVLALTFALAILSMARRVDFYLPPVYCCPTSAKSTPSRV